MVGPEDLFALNKLRFFKGLFARMCAGKRLVLRRLPVLGEHHMRKKRLEPIDNRHDVRALRHGQRTPFDKRILNIDDQQSSIGSHTN